MKFDLKKEVILLFIAIVPIIYLANAWKILPAEVPIHYDINMEVDRYASKTIFAAIILLIFLSSYILLSILPHIDPKNRIKEMGNKFYHVKFILIGSMSMISSFIIYKTIHTDTNMIFVMVLLGIFMIAIGNYYQTIKQNYFLGIRTPWTLENEANWKKTHKITGTLYILGGFFLCLYYFILPVNINVYFSIATMLCVGIIPYLYSFLLFKKTRNLTV